LVQNCLRESYRAESQFVKILLLSDKISSVKLLVSIYFSMI